MRKLVCSLLILLLALPALAQEAVFINSADTYNGYTFSVSLDAGIYVNDSNWRLLAKETSVQDCFQPLIAGAWLYDGGVGYAVPGALPLGVFEIVAACAIDFELITAEDEYESRIKSKVVIAPAIKKKVVNLDWTWQRVRFGKGKYRYMGDSDHYVQETDKGYVINSTQAGFIHCMGDTAESSNTGNKMTVNPRFLKIREAQSCWMRSLNEDDKRTVTFIKW